MQALGGYPAPPTPEQGTYLAQSEPKEPMPGQSPPLKTVGFALGTVGVVVGLLAAGLLPVATRVDVPPVGVEPVSIVATPMAASAIAAPHRDNILTDRRRRRGVDRVDFIGTRLCQVKLRFRQIRR
jgi:hypothetical protein